MQKIEQAINGIQDAIKNISNNLIDCSPDMRIRMTALSQHFEVAISALKKQLPQKVKKWEGLNETACPECGFAFGYYDYDDEKFEYCYNCGQKLDWESEVEHDA